MPCPPCSPLPIPPPLCLPSNRLQRGAGDFCAPREQTLLVFLSLLSPSARVLGGPGHLVLLKDRAVGVARAVCGDYFCRFVKNKTKAGL